MTPQHVMAFTLAHAFSCTPYFLYSPAKSPSLSAFSSSIFRRIVPWLIVPSPTRTAPACVYCCHLYPFTSFLDPRVVPYIALAAVSNTIGFHGIVDICRVWRGSRAGASPLRLVPNSWLNLHTHLIVLNALCLASCFMYSSTAAMLMWLQSGTTSKDSGGFDFF